MLHSVLGSRHSESKQLSAHLMCCVEQLLNKQSILQYYLGPALYAIDVLPA